jgi:hypothetical protein
MEGTEQGAVRHGKGAFSVVDANMPGGSTCVHDYRTHFASHGKSIVHNRGAYDLRRITSWAPFIVVPSVALLTRAVPPTQRVRVWVGTLLAYGFVSALMCKLAHHMTMQQATPDLTRENDFS